MIFRHFKPPEKKECACPYCKDNTDNQVEVNRCICEIFKDAPEKAEEFKIEIHKYQPPEIFDKLKDLANIAMTCPDAKQVTINASKVKPF